MFENIFERIFRMNLTMKNQRNLVKIDKSNKKKRNFDSRANSRRSVFLEFIFVSRRSALAQRQREEEQLKGKLTAEEAKRLVHISNDLTFHFFSCLERTSSSRCY